MCLNTGVIPKESFTQPNSVSALRGPGDPCGHYRAPWCWWLLVYSENSWLTAPDDIPEYLETVLLCNTGSSWRWTTATPGVHTPDCSVSLTPLPLLSEPVNYSGLQGAAAPPRPATRGRPSPSRRWASLCLQTVKGGISETRIEKRIVITGDTEIDHDKVRLQLVPLLVPLPVLLLVPLLVPLLVWDWRGSLSG